MRQRPLGKTGLTISEHCLGTFGLSGDGYGAVPEDDARAVIATALEMGINCIETADAYGGGRLEQLVGEMVLGKPEIVVVTKGGIDRSTEPGRRRFDVPYLEQAIGRSLLRLKKDALDLYLLHHPSEELFLRGEIGGEMKALVDKGLIRHWGVAAGNHDVASLAVAQGAEVVELPYNLLHPIDVNRIGGDAIVSRIGVLARSTLAYGLLAGHWPRDKEFPEGDHRSGRWTRNDLAMRLDQLDLVRFLVRGDVETLRGAAIRFVLANHVVSGAVLGPRTVEQLTQLVRETGVGPRYLSDDSIREVYRALEKVGIPI
jgi:aryl-alcohol dehydrogenase-like predicted oxidoreductase